MNFGTRLDRIEQNSAVRLQRVMNGTLTVQELTDEELSLIVARIPTWQLPLYHKFIDAMNREEADRWALGNITVAELSPAAQAIWKEILEG